MCADHSPVPAEKIRAALYAIPDEFANWVDRAENAGPGGIDLAAGYLLGYAFARLLTDDPRAEGRDTWTALREAGSLSMQYVRALEAEEGDTVRVTVDYLGVGFRFRVSEADGAGPRAGAWLQAFSLALAVGDGEALAALTEHHWRLLPDDDPKTTLARTLAALHRGRSVGLDGVDHPAAHALAQGDHRACAEALREAFARYEADFQGSLRALVPWDLFAVAALAHRHGVVVDVDSVHCPRRLLTGAGPLVRVPDGPIRRPGFHARYAARVLAQRERDAGDELDELFDRPLSRSMASWQFVHFAQQRLEAFAVRSLADPDAEDVRQWIELVLARQAYAAAFRLLSAEPGAPVEVTVGDRAGELRADGGQGVGRGAANYAHAAALAMITRDGDALASLGAVPDAVTLGDDPVGTHAARALRAHLAGRDPREELQEVLDPRNVLDDEAECVFVPAARLLEVLVRGERAAFDPVLAEALELHRQYHSVAIRRGRPESLVAPLPLAMACLARDRGWEVGIGSDYLPRRVVEGAWTSTPLDLTPYRGD
ncbi:immunity 49 family protein [Actinomadura kijaniata]|uniref:immunity 49 family protein n=1 Tax=Actinomadura kijaniata TaxID=46161 RepID=UPI00083091CA|nr:immunity 49 family protein [Actinomadura kijaniata]